MRDRTSLHLHSNYRPIILTAQLPSISHHILNRPTHPIFPLKESTNLMVTHTLIDPVRKQNQTAQLCSIKMIHIRFRNDNPIIILFEMNIANSP